MFDILANLYYIEYVKNIPSPPRHIGKKIVSSHLNGYLDPVELAKKIKIAAKELAKHDFDTIAFRGMSGALIAPPLAMKLKKQLILVRKDNDDSHTLFGVEGNKLSKRYIIVDDFVCSGKTKSVIIEKVAEFAPLAEFIGMVQASYLGDKHLDAKRGPNYPFS